MAINVSFNVPYIHDATIAEKNVLLIQKSCLLFTCDFIQHWVPTGNSTRVDWKNHQITLPQQLIYSHINFVLETRNKDIFLWYKLANEQKDHIITLTTLKESKVCCQPAKQREEMKGKRMMGSCG